MSRKNVLITISIFHGTSIKKHTCLYSMSSLCPMMLIADYRQAHVINYKVKLIRTGNKAKLAENSRNSHYIEPNEGAP